MPNSSKLTEHDSTCIYVECTHTLSSNLCTGIQRVVNNIISNRESCANSLQCKIKPVLFENGEFFLPENSSRFLKANPNSISFFSIKKMLILIVTGLTFLAGAFRLSRKLTSLINLLPKVLHFQDIRVAIAKAIDNFTLVLWRLYFPEVVFSTDDVLLLLDASWHLPIWEKVNKISSNGGIVGCIIYDLIPITHPQFCDKPFIKCFSDWQLKAAATTHFYISISKTVSEELKKFVSELASDKEVSIKPSPIFDYFHLGSNFKPVSSPAIEQISIKSELQSIFDDNEKVYLMVGTIEPRKNHLYTLNTFLNMWKQGSKSKFCIIGKAGWLCENIINEIEGSKYYGSQLLMYNNVSDDELSFAYSRAKALLFPSITEGFGLPIVEALSNGLKVFASDIAVHKEIGQRYCTYFPLNDPDSLLKLLLTDESENQSEIKDQDIDYIPLSWKDSTLNLFQKALKISKKLKAINRSQPNP